MLVFAYYLIITAHSVVEFAIQKWLIKTKMQKPDPGLRLIIFPFYAAYCLAPIEHLLLHTTIENATLVVGFSIFILGVFIRIIGLIALNQNFSIAIEFPKSNTLVTTGIYRYIRHPLYLASILLSATGCLIFSTIICWLFVLMTIIGFLRRIKAEEYYLLQHFGEYKSYVSRSKKLIPFLY